MRGAAALAGCAALAACAPMTGVRSVSAKACPDTIATTASAAGKAWLADQRWRYHSDAEAAAAYTELAKGASPWPDWMKPVEAVLPAGTRIQMALGVGQPPDRPGAFATFDRIGSIEDVRAQLAVRQEWKPAIDRVVTYEVTTPLKVNFGPIGPQVDGATCRLLPGRWSQLQMLVPPEQRMRYLTVVEVRPIR